jgi:hypothetical protein
MILLIFIAAHGTGNREMINDFDDRWERTGLSREL